MKFAKFNRTVHRWGALITAVPVLVVILSGMLLLLKKEVAWIQPPTAEGSGNGLALDFGQVLAIARTVPEARIENWDDIDRLDVRPSKGVIKISAVNRWEIQLDANTGDVLQVAFRASDLIESIHDGTFFHPTVKLGLFLPSAIVLLGLWITGIHLFLLPYLTRRMRRKPRASLASDPP